MRFQGRALLYKTPRVWKSDPDDNGEIRTRHIHQVLVQGEPLEFFCEQDLTHALNGDREKLDTGAPTEVLVTFELRSMRGRPRVELLSLEPLKVAK